MAMTRAQFSSLLVEGLREVFFEWLDLNSLVYPQIYDVRKSKKKTETDRTIAGIGMLDEKDESVAITYDDFVEGYPILNALLKPLLINGESLNRIFGMVTLRKAFSHLQRLSEGAAG